MEGEYGLLGLSGKTGTGELFINSLHSVRYSVNLALRRLELVEPGLHRERLFKQTIFWGKETYSS